MKILELGHVVLYVSELARAVEFYRDTLGFHAIHVGEGVAVFSSSRTHHELLLIEVGGEPRRKTRPEPGLYHIGFKIGDSTKDAERVYRELVEKGVEIVGTGDHGVTHSIYILDPDGNELELYADVSTAWRDDPRAILTPVKRLRFD